MSRTFIDSGIDWIGKIPINWQVKPVKQVLLERKELNKPITVTAILSLTNNRGVIPYSEKGDIGNKSKEDISGYKIVRKGDIVINSMNLYIGSVGLSKYTGVVSPVYYMLYKRNPKDSIEYYNQLFQTKELQSKSHGYGNGILDIRMRIPMSNLNLLPLPVPPSEEQHRIVSILNKKVEQIDRLIKIQEHQIVKLKEYKQSVISNAVTKGLNLNTQMRDSGIDFVGQIPVSWTVKPLKSIFSIKRGSLDKNVEENEISVKLVQYTAIYYNVKLENREPLLNVTATKREIEDASVKHGDLLMTASSETADDIGHTSLIALPDNDLVFGSDIIRLRTNDIDFEYRQFILENKYHLDILTSYCRGITRFRFSMDDFGKHKWIVPPKEEQSLIAKYLNFVSSKVNLLIFQKNLKIEKLNEYKKSLIYEYVTGKREAI